MGSEMCIRDREYKAKERRQITLSETRRKAFASINPYIRAKLAGKDFYLPIILQNISLGDLKKDTIKQFKYMGLNKKPYQTQFIFFSSPSTKEKHRKDCLRLKINNHDFWCEIDLLTSYSFHPYRDRNFDYMDHYVKASEIDDPNLKDISFDIYLSTSSNPRINRNFVVEMPKLSKTDIQGKPIRFRCSPYKAKNPRTECSLQFEIDNGIKVSARQLNFPTKTLETYMLKTVEDAYRVYDMITKEPEPYKRKKS